MKLKWFVFTGVGNIRRVDGRHEEFDEADIEAEGQQEIIDEGIIWLFDENEAKLWIEQLVDGLTQD